MCMGGGAPSAPVVIPPPPPPPPPAPPPAPAVQPVTKVASSQGANAANSKYNRTSLAIPPSFPMGGSNQPVGNGLAIPV